MWDRALLAVRSGVDRTAEISWAMARNATRPIRAPRRVRARCVNEVDARVVTSTRIDTRAALEGVASKGDDSRQRLRLSYRGGASSCGPSSQGPQSETARQPQVAQGRHAEEPSTNYPGSLALQEQAKRSRGRQRLQQQHALAISYLVWRARRRPHGRCYDGSPLIKNEILPSVELRWDAFHPMCSPLCIEGANCGNFA